MCFCNFIILAGNRFEIKMTVTKCDWKFFIEFFSFYNELVLDWYRVNTEGWISSIRQRLGMKNLFKMHMVNFFCVKSHHVCVFKNLIDDCWIGNQQGQSGSRVALDFQLFDKE